jgi:dGTPase
MDDIISISVNNIYQRGDREGDWATNHTNVVDKFITAYDNKYNGNASNYDALILKLLPEKHHYEKQTCMKDCCISVICFFTYGRKLLFYKTITAVKINSCGRLSLK